MKWFRITDRRARWCFRLGLVMILFLFIVSWTRGTVVSPGEGQVGDAEVEVFQWPQPDEFWANCDFVDCWTWAWPNDPNYPDNNEQYTHSTTTTSDQWCPPWPPGASCWPIYLQNWGFRDNYAHCDSHVAEDRIEPFPEWYRFRIEKDGYRPAFYYEFIDDHDEECSIYDCDNDVSYGHDECHTIPPFELIPDNPSEEHELRPDIMVDPRDLYDIEYDCLQEGEGGKVYSVTLRTATGWVNVGTGDFEIFKDGDTVEQRVTTTDSNYVWYDDFPPGMIEEHQSHGHDHMQEWTELRILDADPACEASPDERPSWCDVRTGHKVGACVTSVMLFDEEISNEYGGSFSSLCNEPFEISPGYKDRYHNQLEGQGIQLGATGGSNSLPQGPHLLEAEWDPEGTWQANGSFRERDNTRAFIEIDIPAFSTSTQNCDEFSNCLNWQELGDNQHTEEGQRKNRCRDHLRCETDSDCVNLHGGPCVAVSGETDKFCEI